MPLIECMSNPLNNPLPHTCCRGMAECNISLPSEETINEARKASWATRAFSYEAFEFQQSVSAALKKLEEGVAQENKWKFPVYQVVIDDEAKKILKPRGAGFFREWPLSHNMDRLEYVPDSALMMTAFTHVFSLEEAREFLMHNLPGPRNKDHYVSVDEMVADFLKNRPLYGQMRTYRCDDVNFCTRLEYPMNYDEVFPHRGAAAFETVVYFRDTVSTALLYGQFGVASQILHHRGGWIRSDHPLLFSSLDLNVPVLQKHPMIADSAIASGNPAHVAHAACLLEGYYLKYYVEKDESDGEPFDSFPHLPFIQRWLFELEWGPKYGAIARDDNLGHHEAIREIKDKIFGEELPPWMRLFAGYKVGHLCRDFADQFHMYCNPGRLRIAPGVTGRQPPTGRQTRERIGRLTAGTAGRKA